MSSLKRNMIMRKLNKQKKLSGPSKRHALETA
jgi:hypothetical protein